MRGLTRPVRSAVAGLCVLGVLAHGGDARADAQGAPTSRVVVAPSRATGALGPLINIPQTWNNCGPASISEVLAYWGVWRTQAQVQAVLRVDGPSRGMMPYGVPAYALNLGLRALVGVAGTEALVKALVSNGFPVIVSQQVSLTNHIGHYRPIEAYDDRQGIFVASDPYLGQNHVITDADFARIWTRSGDGFIVLYPPSRQALLSAVLVSVGWDRTRAYRADLARLQARLRMGPLRGRTVGAAGAPRWDSGGYRYLGQAWDEAELGQDAAARQDLQRAARQGANPIEVGWIAGEIAQHGA